MRTIIFWFSLFLFVFLPPLFNGGNNDLVIVIEFLLGGLLLITAFQKNSLTGSKRSKESQQERVDSSGDSGGDHRIWEHLKNPWIWGVVFIISFFLSTLFSNSPYFSWSSFLEVFLLFSVFSVLLSVSLDFSSLKNLFGKNSNFNLLEIFAFLFVGISFILVLIGIYFYETGVRSGMTSTFYNSNAFAGYLLFALPVALYLFFSSKYSFQGKYLISFSAILILSAFILTGSRGGYLSFLIPLLLLIGLFFRIEDKKRILKKTGILLLGCFLAVNILFSVKEGKFSIFFVDSPKVQTSVPKEKTVQSSSPAVSSGKSITDRLSYWKGGMEMFKEKPWLGWGLGSYKDIYPRFQSRAESYAKYPHNYYVGVLSETGIVGAVPFYLFILTLLYWGIKRYKEQITENKGEILSSVLFLSVLGSVLHSGVDFDWRFGANFIAFFVFSGLFLNKEVMQNISRAGGKINKHLLGYIIGIVFIIIALVLGYSFNHFNQGKNLEKNKRYREALEIYKKGTSINPHPQYLLRKGILLYSFGKLEESEKTANQIKEVAPNQKDVWRLHAKIKQKKEGEKAEEYYKRSLKIDPYFAKVYIELSNFYINNDKLSQARKILDKGISQFDESSIGYFRKKREDFARVLGIKETKCDLTKVDEIADLYLERSKVAKQLNSKGEARKFLERAQEIRAPVNSNKEENNK